MKSFTSGLSGGVVDRLNEAKAARSGREQGWREERLRPLSRATGARLSPGALTAAHRFLPFGTKDGDDDRATIVFVRHAHLLVLLPLDVEYTDATPLWLWLLLALVIDGDVLTENRRKPVAVANIRCVLNLCAPC
jgi:hypothetical protein